MWTSILLLLTISMSIFAHLTQASTSGECMSRPTLRITRARPVITQLYPQILYNVRIAYIKPWLEQDHAWLSYNTDVEGLMAGVAISVCIMRCVYSHPNIINTSFSTELRNTHNIIYSQVMYTLVSRSQSDCQTAFPSFPSSPNAKEGKAVWLRETMYTQEAAVS